MNITVEDFIQYSGYSKDNVNLVYLNFLLNNIENQIIDKIGALFTLTNITDADYTDEFDFYGSNIDLVKIGAWQTENLVVKLGTRGTTTLDTLVRGHNFKLKLYKDRFIPGQANPVIAIQFLNFGGLRRDFDTSNSVKLYNDQFLRIRGVLGWSNNLPDDLKLLLFKLVKNELEVNKTFTDSEGKGFLQSEKSINLESRYSTNGDVQKLLLDTAMNIMSNPAVVNSINYYKQYTTRQVSIS